MSNRINHVAAARQRAAD